MLSVMEIHVKLSMRSECRRRVGRALFFVGVLTCLTRGGMAQPDAGVRGKLTTVIDFTVLTPQFGGRVEAQEWSRVFANLGYSPQFRSSILGDELSVTETVRGRVRTVKVLGEMDEKGTITFGTRKFSKSDGKQLSEWIDELKAYGAQGAPEGQPLWGMNKDQFSQLYAALSLKEKDAETSVGLPLAQAIGKLPIPEGFPVRVATSAEKALGTEVEGPAVRNDTRGLSTGTALAILLRDAGLGFRPLRTPTGNIELKIQRLSEISDPWPIGWPLPEPDAKGQAAPAPAAAPQLYKFVEVGFEKVALEDVLIAAGAAIEVPIIIDYPAMGEAKVDLQKLLVTFPQKKTSWSLMLNSILRQVKLTKVLMLDEAGKAFLDVTLFRPKRIELAP
ncbi:MAG: hypothetical protein R3C01_16275 [Planctomycetaceae bacterium]